MKRATIKNRQKETLLFRKRLLILVAFVLVLVVLLFIRLAYLQFFQHHYYKTLSAKNNITLAPISPKRGLIYDRNGLLLAKNNPVFNLMVNRSQVTDFQQELNNLQLIISISPAEIQLYKREAKQKRQFEPVPLKVKLTDKQVALFAVNRFQYPGFHIQAQLIRQYPQKTITANVVGYVGRINVEELANIDPSNYAATDYIGKTGVEKSFESQLHGGVGYKQIEINASGETVRTLNEFSPQSGVNLYLTIDTNLQQAAKQALQGLRGAVVAVDPNTGQVLALVSTPIFNPNTFIRGISTQDYSALQNNPDHPLFDRATRGLYPPGSTIKPFIALAGLDSGTVTPKTKLYDPGWFKIPGSEHVYHNWMRGGFGWVDLSQAIIHSDDVYFYQLAMQLGIDRIDSFLDQFGFGQKTGIELNDELAGHIPSPDYKMHLTGHRWFTGDTVTTGIGQSYFQITPIQLAMATAALSLHGKRMKAQLIEGYQFPNQPRMVTTPQELPPVILQNPMNWQTVITAMHHGVTNPQGTSHLFGFGNPIYPAAAKTGTAQVYTVSEDNKGKPLPERERDDSLFIAFAPINHPQIALAVVVENNPSAPRIARKVMDYYMLAQKHWKPEQKPHAS